MEANKLALNKGNNEEKVINVQIGKIGFASCTELFQKSNISPIYDYGFLPRNIIEAIYSDVKGTSDDLL
ncbi:MAG: hypothetical protein ACYTXC_06665 [Nostoc sp.]